MSQAAQLKTIYVPHRTKIHKVREKSARLQACVKNHLTPTVVVVQTKPEVSELLTEIIINNKNIFINENFTLTSEQTLFEIERLVTRNCENGWIVTVFRQTKLFDKIKLSTEARRIVNTPNAGGDSVKSEAMSFELLNKFLNAKLLMTEMEVTYFPEGGSITDYVLVMFNRVVAVSVTRAMKYGKDQVFTKEDAHLLLKKKLKGVKQSSRNMLFPLWEKQILHVWVYDEAVARTLYEAWKEMDDDIKMNTVVLVTLAKNSAELFINQKKKVVKRRKTT
jgi:hypothetical protein